MSNKQDKRLRGQLRQLVQELLPEILSEQILQQIQKDLAGQLREGLSKIDERQSQLQSYIVRNAGVPATPPSQAKQ